MLLAVEFVVQLALVCAEQVLTLMLQRQELESLKLSQRVRKSVEDAVEGLGGRVTVGDVAARAGVKISEAEEALNALAADAGGTLEVSQQKLFCLCHAQHMQMSWLCFMSLLQ